MSAPAFGAAGGRAREAAQAGPATATGGSQAEGGPATAAGGSRTEAGPATAAGGSRTEAGPAPAPGPGPGAALVVLTGAARSEGRPLFGPLTLALETGGWTCLLGPSGTGKTTLLRLIAGLPTGVEFAGSVAGRPPVALMAQDPGLLPWLDLMGNVTIGARLRGEAPDLARGRGLLTRVGLGERAAARPAQLSGGQRQRVALARTLMEDRPLVLLDEPFSALDARTRAEMQDLAAGMLAGRTVLLVTHDPGEAARLGHRILLLTEAGLSETPAPAAPPPRPADAPEVLAAQGALLRRLLA